MSEPHVICRKLVVLYVHLSMLVSFLSINNHTIRYISIFNILVPFVCVFFFSFFLFFSLCFIALYYTVLCCLSGE